MVLKLAMQTALGAVLAVSSFALGCGDDLPAVPLAGSLALVPLVDVALVKPGETARVSFRLKRVSGDNPVANERVTFSAVDDAQTPGSDLAGATLAASSTLTGDDGLATVSVTGGLPTIFLLTARHRLAPVAEVLVVVSEGGQGRVSVVASPVGGSSAAAAVTTVDLLFFDTLACSALSLTRPTQPMRPVRTVAPSMPAEFEINNMVPSAILGQGRDGNGKLRAAGCVDLPANTIVAGSAVQVYLPLAEWDPTPRGTFLLSSHISLGKRDITKRMAAPWIDLGDCPLDPGQLWLDCAIDALGAPPGDALDCVPAAIGEGDLADLIASRRGAAVAGTSCRGVTALGMQGIDAKVAALFPSPAAPAATIAPSLGAIVAVMLDDVGLGSTLSLENTASPHTFHGTHTLRTATFQVGSQSTMVDVLAQGGPASQARLVPVSTVGDVLSIDAHGLALHLGTLAHIAFSNVALVGRDLPAASTDYVALLFSAAASGTGTTRKTGCDALDALVCGEVGRPVGCLRAACVAGQAALAARLDAAFTLLNGDGADLQLAGSATMTDDDGDGWADRLGLSSRDPALWTGQIRARAGTEIFSGSWNGAPSPP
jgi:hypothetical protein